MFICGDTECCVSLHLPEEETCWRRKQAVQVTVAAVFCVGVADILSIF